jgi:hypothetical protein
MTRGAPGNLLTVVFPGGTVPVANQLVVDNHSPNSQAIIDSVSGQTATMQTPQTTASLTNTATLIAPAEDLTWTTGDSMTVYTLLNTNAKRWRPVGGDISSGLRLSGGYVQYASIADTSASNVGSYEHNCASATNVLVNCVINSGLTLGNEGGKGAYPTFSTVLAGCSTVGTTYFNGSAVMYGGATKGGINQLGGTISITNDAIIHSNAVTLTGMMITNNVYSDGAYQFYSTASSIYELGYLWGSYSPTMFGGAVVLNATGTTYAAKALLTSGTIKLDLNTTGSAYGGSGAWTDGITLTPAHIDTGGAGGSGLWNPLTGSHYGPA